MKGKFLLIILGASFLYSFIKPKPTLFLIGDSTVKTGKGIGENEMWGWGSVLHKYLDTTKIHIENRAIGGRSSRTFLTDGRWEPILNQMKKGDFLIMQFGHNDDWALNDTIRARGTIKGIGTDSVQIQNLLTKKPETVHSYGWYLRKYIKEAKTKGIKVYVCSPVPFNKFENGKVKRKQDFYPLWAKQVAEEQSVDFIDIHERSAKVYDQLGYSKVKEEFFTLKDDVHTNIKGAELNALSVKIEIKKTKLKKYFL